MTDLIFVRCVDCENTFEVSQERLEDNTKFPYETPEGAYCKICYLKNHIAEILSNIEYNPRHLIQCCNYMYTEGSKCLDCDKIVKSQQINNEELNEKE